MTNTVTAPQEQLILGHPKGLFVCFFTEMWERFSFYGMKALLFLYLVKYHLFADENGYNLLGAYGALVYAVPVIGGLLADRYLGMRRAVIFGACLLVLGHLGMAFEGHQATKVGEQITRDEGALQVFYFSLALIIMGVGFLKPNISTIVGKLYPEHDPRRDSGFTIFYAGINVGATIAPLICAWLGETYGWKYGFGLAGIGMLAGLLVFIFGQKHLHGHGESNYPERLAALKFGLRTEYWIYLGGLAGVALVWGLVQTHSLKLAFGSWSPELSPVTWVLHSITFVLTIGISWYVIRNCNKVQRDQMIVLFMIILAGLLFFALYEQTYGAWVAFSDRVMDRNMFGLELSAGQLTFMGAGFILLLTPLFAWLWPWLESKNLNPAKPYKMGYGLLFAGLAFGVLSIGTNLPMESGLISVWWLVLAYLVLEIGEMTLSPISLSAVTQLSVKQVVSLMMGAWFLGTSYSEILAAELSKLSAMETEGGVVTDVGAAIAKYDGLWVYSFELGLGFAAFYFVIAPLLKKMMHGVD